MDSSIELCTMYVYGNTMGSFAFGDVQNYILGHRICAVVVYRDLSTRGESGF